MKTAILLDSPPKLSKTHTPIVNQFDKWWAEEGSGIPPLHGEDTETHVHRVCKIAWLTGVVKTLESM